MASSKEKFALPKGVLLSVPTRASPRKSKPAKSSFTVKSLERSSASASRFPALAESQATWRRAALSSKMAQSCAARSKVVKKTNRPSFLHRRLAQAPKRPLPQAGGRPNNRSSDAEGFLMEMPERHDHGKNFS